MTVTVVALLWRNESYVRAFVDSLAVAARRAHQRVQLVAVVNGPDGEAAADALRQFVTADSPVELVMVALPDNVGFAGGVNAGCRVATGDTFVVANVDLEFGPQFIEALLAHADINRAPNFLAPLVHTVVRTADGRASSTEEGPVERDHLHRLRQVAGPLRAGDAVPGANGSCLVFGRALLDERVRAVGGLFDEEYHSYYEDVDLFWWAERAGIRTSFAPDLVVTHHQGGSFGGRFRFQERSRELRASVMANYRLTVWKHVATPTAVAGWMAGEVGYLGLNLRGEGARGAATYGRSWMIALQRAKAIRRRRGSLRT